MDPIYIHASSTDSLDLHPNNTSADFTIELPEVLKFRFKVGLVEFFSEYFNEPILVFSDFIESSYVASEEHALLRIVKSPGEFKHIQFHKGSRQSIKRIRIYLTNQNLEVPSTSLGRVTCSLLLIPY